MSDVTRRYCDQCRREITCVERHWRIEHVRANGKAPEDMCSVACVAEWAEQRAEEVAK